MLSRWIGKVAIVTGASSGIGASVCQRFVDEGLLVAGLSRRIERIQELSKSLENKKGKLFPVKCDVTKLEEVQKSFKWVKDNVGPVQILINNAGLVKLGTVIEGNPEDFKTVIDTNLLAVCSCSKEAFSQMKESGLEGHIVHMNSVSGHWATAGYPMFMNVYSPVKHALTCLTECMRQEVLHTNTHVRVTSVSPGSTRTEIGEAADVKLESFYTQRKITGEDVADAVAYVIGTPPHVHVQELILRPYISTL